MWCVAKPSPQYAGYQTSTDLDFGFEDFHLMYDFCVDRGSTAETGLPRLYPAGYQVLDTAFTVLLFSLVTTAGC